MQLMDIISSLFSIFAGTMAVCEIRFERHGDLFRSIQDPIPVPNGYKFYFRLMNQGSNTETFTSITAEHATSFQIALDPPFTADVDVEADGSKWYALHLTAILGSPDALPATHGLAIKAIGSTCGVVRERVIVGIQVNIIITVAIIFYFFL